MMTGIGDAVQIPVQLGGEIRTVPTLNAAKFWIPQIGFIASGLYTRVIPKIGHCNTQKLELGGIRMIPTLNAAQLGIPQIRAGLLQVAYTNSTDRELAWFCAQILQRSTFYYLLSDSLLLQNSLQRLKG